jgi:hypothetical protein
MSATFPAILGALFGAPVLSFKPSDITTQQDTGNGDSNNGKSGETKCEQSFADAWKQIKGWITNQGGDKLINRLGLSLVITTVVMLLLLFACILMVLIYYLIVTYKNYKNSRKTMEQLALETKVPYKDHIYYQVMNPSILGAPYKYRALFYVSAVAFSLGILAIIIKQGMIQVPGGDGAKLFQVQVQGTECTKDDETILSNIIFWAVLSSLYLFAVFYWFVEKNYFNKIADLNAKITDFNQYIRSILPSNYEFLTLVSKPYEGTVAELDTGLFKPAIAVTRPKRRDIVRTICILNLYTYYHSQSGLYTNSGGVGNVLECFNPIQRLLGSSPTCFSDYLINNNAYIHNHVDKYIQLFNELGGESEVARAFNNNRTQILLDVDRMMAEINQRAGCLGSAYAYNLFMRMNVNLMFVVWAPILIYLGFKGGKMIQSKQGTGTGTAASS